MSKFHFVDPAELSKPAKGLAVNHVDDWWLVDAQGRIAFFPRPGSSKYLSPQCNSDRRIAERIAGGGLFEWAVGAIQIPLVSVPANASDWSGS